MNEKNDPSRHEALAKATNKIQPEIDEIAKRLCEIDDMTLFIETIAYIIDAWRYDKDIPDRIMDRVVEMYLKEIR